MRLWQRGELNVHSVQWRGNDVQTEESRAQSLDGHGAREEQFWDYFWTICKVLTIGVCYSCKFTFVLRQLEPDRRLVRSTMNITNLKLF